MNKYYGIVNLKNARQTFWFDIFGFYFFVNNYPYVSQYEVSAKLQLECRIFGIHVVTHISPVTFTRYFNLLRDYFKYELKKDFAFTFSFKRVLKWLSCNHKFHRYGFQKRCDKCYFYIDDFTQEDLTRYNLDVEIHYIKHCIGSDYWYKYNERNGIKFK